MTDAERIAGLERQVAELQRGLQEAVARINSLGGWAPAGVGPLVWPALQPQDWPPMKVTC